MRRATIRSISDETGLSLATVSRALKASPAVRPDTARLVRDAAAKLGYRRSAVAANLRTGRTGLLSLVIPVERPGDLLGDFGAGLLLAGACSRLAGSDHTLTLVPYGFNDRPGDVVEDLVGRGVSDGIILTLTRSGDERVRWLQARDIPFVTFGRTALPEPHAFFDFDDEDFAYRATRSLIARGCRRPALVVQDSDALYVQHRRTGFRRALGEAGLPYATRRIVAQNGATVDPSLVAGTEPPDGIVCDNEISALATAALLQGAGKVVGRDVHLTTLAASDLPGLLSPPIPSFFQDLRRAGWVCADFLLRRLAGEDAAGLRAVEVMGPRTGRGGADVAA